MDVLSLVINVVLVVLTLVVIWYARRTVMESRHATHTNPKPAAISEAAAPTEIRSTTRPCNRTYG
jgi:Tfp pilus assembly protein PilX